MLQDKHIIIYCQIAFADDHSIMSTLMTPPVLLIRHCDRAHGCLLFAFICHSQATLTAFSIAFARYTGEMTRRAKGTMVRSEMYLIHGV